MQFPSVLQAFASLSMEQQRTEGRFINISIKFCLKWQPYLRYVNSYERSARALTYGKSNASFLLVKHSFQLR